MCVFVTAGASATPGKDRNRFDEVATVEKLDKGNDVAALPASPAIKYLLARIDCESVGAAAQRARSDALDATAQPETALLHDALDRNTSGDLYRSCIDGHADAVSLLRAEWPRRWPRGLRRFTND
jgi:hypothetical protein